MNWKEYKKQLLINRPDTIKEEEIDEYILKLQKEANYNST